jgi:hypothetical protein
MTELRAYPGYGLRGKGQNAGSRQTFGLDWNGSRWGGRGSGSGSDDTLAGAAAGWIVVLCREARGGACFSRSGNR